VSESERNQSGLLAIVATKTAPKSLLIPNWLKAYIPEVFLTVYFIKKFVRCSESLGKIMSFLITVSFFAKPFEIVHISYLFRHFLQNEGLVVFERELVSPEQF